MAETASTLLRKKPPALCQFMMKYKQENELKYTSDRRVVNKFDNSEEKPDK